jgi:hypothetical protein
MRKKWGKDLDFKENILNLKRKKCLNNLFPTG